VGGGVGLPPMFYLARALQSAGWSGVAFVGAMSRDLLPIELDPNVTIPDDGTPVLAERRFADAGLPVCLTTDDGSLGLPGRITDGLARYLDALPGELAGRTVVYTCGPHAMMRAVARLALDRGLPCQVCVEQAMACGMGTCQSCVVKIALDQPAPSGPDAAHGVTPEGQAWRYRLACAEGPVFNADDVLDFRRR